MHHRPWTLKRFRWIRRPAAWALIATAILTASCQLLAEEAEEPVAKLDVWPGRAPGEPDDPEQPEAVLPNRPDEAHTTMRVGHVSRPTIEVFKPKAEIDTGTAVLICPGGGYHILAYDKEGTEVAQWLNRIGVTGIVLKYRVPRRKDRPVHEAPLQDAQRALRLCRKHADEWGIAQDRLGILGFSAGGHLAAMACTDFDSSSYEAIDQTDNLNARPDFGILIYPGYLLDRENPDQLAPELLVTENTPPMFFAHAGDDRVSADGSLRMALALREVDVPCEVHIYASGGHGFGLRPSEKPCSQWPTLCEQWMADSGWLDSTGASNSNR